MRSNFGLELRMGNHSEAAAAMDAMDRSEILHRHPAAQVEEARAVARLGGPVYMRRAGREALAWIAANPRRFARLTAERFVLWWLGPLDAPSYAWLTVALVSKAAASARSSVAGSSRGSVIS